MNVFMIESENQHLNNVFTAGALRFICGLLVLILCAGLFKCNNNIDTVIVFVAITREF